MFYNRIRDKRRPIVVFGKQYRKKKKRSVGRRAGRLVPLKRALEYGIIISLQPVSDLRRLYDVLHSTTAIIIIIVLRPRRIPNRSRFRRLCTLRFSNLNRSHTVRHHAVTSAHVKLTPRLRPIRSKMTSFVLQLIYDNLPHQQKKKKKCATHFLFKIIRFGMPNSENIA